MSPTRSERSSNPPSAAKNGTCVVPAWVTSGASPETAAFRIRSNWTSQPTSWTFTSMPVFFSNGLMISSVSPTGSGPLFMIQNRTEAFLVELPLPPPLSSSPPAAATAQTPIPIATTATIAITSLLIEPLLPTPRTHAATPGTLAPKTILAMDALNFASSNRTPLGSNRFSNRRAADHELDRQRHHCLRVPIPLHAPYQRLAGRGPEALLVLAQSRQRWLGMPPQQ